MSDLPPQNLESAPTQIATSTWPRAVGFIGLGSKSSHLLPNLIYENSPSHTFYVDMGWPMAKNLRQKLPQETTLYVYDVIQTLVKEFVGDQDPRGKSGECRVCPCESSREVTEKSVSDSLFEFVYRATSGLI